MENLKSGVEKLCNFYVSELHLVTMILPYINKELNEKANITTILENDMENNIKTLMSKLNLKNEKEILEIEWKEFKGTKYAEFNEKIETFTNHENNTHIIFINGSKNYIDFVNKNIERWISDNGKRLKSTKLKIINCYEVTEFNDSIREILETHDKVLNTTGERYIADVFDGYQIKMA